MAAFTKPREIYTNIVLLIARLGVSALMLTHGWPKLQKLMAGGEIKFADPMGIGATATLVLVVFAEVACSVLIGIGFKTRLATIPLIATMLTAGFVIHAADPISQKEKSFLFLIIYLFLLLKGSGKISLDYLAFGRK